MKFYLAKIDENGMWLEDVEFDELPMTIIELENGDLEQVQNQTYVPRCTEGGFYHPKWDEEKWVEGKVQSFIDELELADLLKPSSIEMEQAEFEIRTIELLVIMGVL